MANKITVKTTIKGIVDINGEETTVDISVENEVTDGDYIDAIRNGIINSLARAIATGFDSMKMAAQQEGEPNNG